MVHLNKNFKNSKHLPSQRLEDVALNGSEILIAKVKMLDA
jgi:hypothetical protein